MVGGARILQRILLFPVEEVLGGMLAKRNPWNRFVGMVCSIAFGVLPPLQKVPADFVHEVPEASEYELIYDLPIEEVNAFNAEVPYALNRAGSIPPGSFDRVAYYLELDDDWVWVSMDAFSVDAAALGVPHATLQRQQRDVSNLNVFSGDPAAVLNGTNFTTGSIEFWSRNYSRNVNTNYLPVGDNEKYDVNDTLNDSGGYGCMQIHNHGVPETILAINRFNNQGVSDLGIGSGLGVHPDWTFEQNADIYTNKRMKIFVRRAAEQPVPAEVLSRVADAIDYRLVYALPIEVANNFTESVLYTIDQSRSSKMPVCSNCAFSRAQ